MSASLCAREHISRTIRLNFANFSLHVACGRFDLAVAALQYVLYFRFVDDVIFVGDVPYGAGDASHACRV